MADPQNLQILDELRFATGCEISPRMGFKAEVTARIAREYGGQPQPAVGTVDLEQGVPAG